MTMPDKPEEAPMARPDHLIKYDAVAINRQMAQLEGARIVSTIPVLTDDEWDGQQLWPALEVELSDGTRKMCLVQRDAEGNGPGFLSVEDV